jgi:hypothetical protein
VEAVATSLGLSTPSQLSTAITVDLTAAAVPVAPATLTVSATALNWAAATGVSTNATVTYTVQKSVDGGTTWTAVTGPTAARTFAIASPVGTNYQYRVAAQATRYGLAASALPTLAAGWRTTTFNTLPAQSTALTNALAATPARTFNVGFTNTSTNISGWIIQRGVSTTAAGAVTWTPVAVTPTGVGSAYTFSNTVGAAGFYRFRVQATSAAGSTAIVTTPIVQTP